MTVFRGALLVGAVVCLPALGSVGLWDPWETHYAEVGRQMLARADLVHPFWENAYFFSKPPLVAWISAGALFFSGAQPWGVPVSGPLPSWIEWVIRLPVALLLMFAVAYLADTVARASNRRVGLLTAVVLWTMPLFDFVSRQLMADGPFVALLIIALAGALRTRWIVTFVAMGFALLTKGLLGLLPLVVLPIAWTWLDGKQAWKRLKTVPWWGPLITLGIGAPWYLAMARFTGVDEEGKHFVERFFGYDHFDRFLSGVHTTTPGGTFTYFIEQGAFAIGPWILAAFLWARKGDDGPSREVRVTLGVSALFSFALFTLSATRFHHYVLPVLPGLAVLTAFALDELLTQGFEGRKGALALGAVAFALVWKDVWRRPRHWVDLFTYNHERPYPDAILVQPFDVKIALLVALGVLALALAAAAWRKEQRTFVGSWLAFAAALALFLSWEHWPALGRHWTQRSLVAQYWAQRHDGERLGAFLMNWKGETFYSRNEVRQISARDPAGELRAFVEGPGREYVVVEAARLNVLERVIPPGNRLEVVDNSSQNKFVLVAVSPAQ